MSKLTDELRQRVSLNLDALEMAAFNSGFEAAVNGIDEISNAKHNQGDSIAAEVLRWVSLELRGENIES